ncbi:MAG: YbdD/YjiX family protein [Rubrobacter sp.]|nr:YbdD/YjiX family protein [Rubrobacter sp.]
MNKMLRPVLSTWWYLKEISGENAYDHYLAVHGATHPDRQPMNRGEFYRRQQDEKYNNPGSRCP